MGWRSQLLWSNLSTLTLEFQLENLEAPSEDPILQSQTTGVRIQWIDPPYSAIKQIERVPFFTQFTSHGAKLNNFFGNKRKEMRFVR
jgi:hypothetical protein